VAKRQPKKSKKPKTSRKLLEKRLDTAWSESVRKRDVVCQKCGGGGCLQAHHVFSRRNRSLRWDVENGVTLCLPCHKWWAHRCIGDFYLWFRQKYGEERAAYLEQKVNQIYKPTIEELEGLYDNLLR